jgi:hypothetical protein
LVLNSKSAERYNKAISIFLCLAQFFSILAFFYYILRNEPGQNFFLNLTLLSRVSPSDATYEEVKPCALAR